MHEKIFLAIFHFKLYFKWNKIAREIAFEQNDRHEEYFDSGNDNLYGEMFVTGQLSWLVKYHILIMAFVCRQQNKFWKY